MARGMSRTHWARRKARAVYHCRSERYSSRLRCQRSCPTHAAKERDHSGIRKWFPVDLDINELVDALRAQATAVTKNPPIAGYVGQANIAQGPQQVINETATRARENETRNELLEQTTHEPDQWLERGAPEGQAQAIHKWQPWTKSTGPKTAAGKATTSQNAWQGGTRPLLRELARLLR